MREMVPAGNTRFCRSCEVFFKGIIHMLIMNSELAFKITCWSNLFLIIIDRIKAREQTFTIRTIKLAIHVQQHVWSKEQIEFWQSSQWSYLLSSLMKITLRGSIHRNLWNFFFFLCVSPGSREIDILQSRVNFPLWIPSGNISCFSIYKE